MLQRGKGFFILRIPVSFLPVLLAWCFFYLFEGGFLCCGVVAVLGSSHSRSLESVVGTSVWSHLWDILSCAGRAGNGSKKEA